MLGNDDQHVHADDKVEAGDAANIQLTPGEIVIGTLAGVDSQGRPLVRFSYIENKPPSVATSTVEVHPKYLGRQVALAFSGSDIRQPIILGYVHSPLDSILSAVVDDASPLTADKADSGSSFDSALVDGERVLIEAKEEIVLQCGESSITLTKAGKIMIRGKYLLNRSSGVNRIMGGSVQVN